MNKYHAKKAEVDGHKFDSMKEANRYCELKLMERAGAITSLILQPKFELQPAYTNADGKKQRAINYIADFMYYDIDLDRTIVEDVKSPATRTQVYMVKKKLFEYKFGMVVREI